MVFREGQAASVGVQPTRMFGISAMTAGVRTAVLSNNGVSFQVTFHPNSGILPVEFDTIVSLSDDATVFADVYVPT